MKKATYEFKTKRYGKLIGYVTLSGGKVTVSIPNINRYGLNAAEKYQARDLGKKIAELDFKHDAVIDVQSQDSSKLITLLTEQTQDLKEAYITRTIEWAKVRFEDMVNLIDRPAEEWYNDYRILYTIDLETRVIEVDTIEYNRPNLNAMRKAKERMYYVVEKGIAAYEKEKVEAAKMHYEGSIMKLANRLNAKGVTDDTEVTINSGHIGQNFECYIKWSGGYLTAWTIIASGPVQAPHYRYLIK